jgi:hypothetical protein
MQYLNILVKIIIVNEKSDGCSGNHHEVTCELDPVCIWIDDNRCVEEISSDHTSHATCTLHPSCTWWENKCYTMPSCKGKTIPYRLSKEFGCQYLVMIPLPTPNDFALPYGPEQNPNCLAIIDSFIKPISDSYNPQDCVNDLRKPANYNALKTACKDDAQYLDKWINLRCGYWPEADVKRKVQQMCEIYYSTFPDPLHDNLCTVGEDQTARTKDPGSWKQIMHKGEPYWYAYECKDYINCTTP